MLKFLVQEINNVKMNVSRPNSLSLGSSIMVITNYVTTFLSAIYFFLINLEDNILKELLMESMQSCLHCMMICQVAVSTKMLYYHVFNPDLLLYLSFRNTLLNISLILKTVVELNILIDMEDTELEIEDKYTATSYIMHFGRDLFDGVDAFMDGEESGEEPEDILDNLRHGIEHGDLQESVDALGVEEAAEKPKEEEKAKAYDPFEDDDFLLNCNPDDYNINNLPPGYPPAPEKPVFDPDGTEEDYKDFMIAKLEYERWENRIIVYKRKLAERIADRKRELNM